MKVVMAGGYRTTNTWEEVDARQWKDCMETANYCPFVRLFISL